MKIHGPRIDASPSHVKRLFWLLACVSVGLAVALIGVFFTGSPVWYVAVPAAIAVGWLFLANPTECEPHAHQQRNDSDRDEPAA